jgi:hypothetical protein
MKAGLVVYRYHVPRIVVCVFLSARSSALKLACDSRPRFRIGDCDVVTKTLTVCTNDQKGEEVVWRLYDVGIYKTLVDEHAFPTREVGRVMTPSLHATSRGGGTGRTA